MLFMDAPEKKIQPNPSSLFSKFQDSPIFNNLSTLSPIRPFNLSFTSSQSSLPSSLANGAKEPKVTRAILLHDKEKRNCSQTVIELPKSLMHDSTKSNVGGTEKSSPEVNHNISKKVAESSFENEEGKQQIPMEKYKKAYECGTLMSEALDPLNCGSPAERKYHKELNEKTYDSDTPSFVATLVQPPRDCIDDTNRSVKKHDLESALDKPGVQEANVASLGPSVKSCAVLAEEVVHSLSAKQDDKQQKMTKRPCLVYEMSGSHYRELLSSCPISKPSVNPNTSKEKCLIPRKFGSNKVSSLHRIIDFANAGSDSNEPKDTFQEKACQSLIYGDNIESPQGSPKKKRQKPEYGESDSCKRCNCKRSKCLKLYCECFAARLYCLEPCNCHDCFNKPTYEDTVLDTRRQIESHNPLAFAPKVIKSSNTRKNTDELNQIPDLARHKRGCNCKKSGCLKKYCECFQVGVGCSLSCRCQGCKNTFGQKEGSKGLALYGGKAQLLEKSSTAASACPNYSKTDVDRPLELSKRQDG